MLFIVGQTGAARRAIHFSPNVAAVENTPGDATATMPEIAPSTAEDQREASPGSEHEYNRAVQEPTPRADATAFPSQRTPALTPARHEDSVATDDDAGDTPAASIKITRGRSTDEYNILLRSAYENYLDGDYAAASKNYRAVLRQFPDNRDVLLGLAAIATREQRRHDAYLLYLEALKFHPRDNTARAALLALHREEETAASIGALRALLDANPAHTFLHHALGHFHATRSRWDEARKSFFNAHTLAPDAPVHAFNLAVSLEHTGNRELALGYYRIALHSNARAAGAGHTAPRTTPGAFDTAAAEARVSALTQAITGTRRGAAN